MKLYHATSLTNAKKIKEKGLESHSWLAKRKSRAMIYKKFNEQKDCEKNTILEFIISKKELEKRILTLQSSNETGFEYLLHSYKLKKLRPIEVKK